MNSNNCEEKKPPVATSTSFPSSRSREHGLSVFHCDLPPGAYVQTDDCLMAVQQCIEALNGWCEAGTRTVTVFLKALKGTVYAQMAAQLRGAMNQVQEIAAMETMKLQKSLKTNWCHLSRFSGASNLQTDQSKDNQIIAKELMNFVGTVYQLFLNMAQHLGQFINCGSNSGSSVPSVSESYSAVPICQNPIQFPVGSRPGVLGNRSKVVAGGSPAGLRKQVTSFLSKIGQKSPDTSCFYVPLDAEGGKSPSSATAPGGQPCQGSPGCSAEHVEGKSNGHVATQEDLDLVISMLSQGCRVPVTGMQAIPEHPTTVQPAVGGHRPTGLAVCGLSLAGQPSGAGLNLGLQAVGPAYTKPPPINPPVGFVDKSLQNSKSSEALSAEVKMNTWPFKLNQKVLWQAGDLQMAQTVFGGTDYESMMKESASAQTHHPGTWPVKEGENIGAATLNNIPNWYSEGLWPTLNTYDMSGIWPSQYSTWNTDSTNSLSKSVSTVVESSSGSEESSNGGDQPWPPGSQVPRRRRHSSGEHSLLSQHATLSNLLPSGIHISVDAPTDDKYGWTSHLQMMDKMTGADERGHKTLSMQWSDPLTNRTLFCWDSDVLPVSKSQSSTPVSNGTYAMKPTAPSGGQLDKSF